MNVYVHNNVLITIENNSTINIFPNPTTDNMVQIQLKGTFDYRLVDLKGSQVLNGQGYNLTQLDLQELDNGIYFLEIRQANKLATEKMYTTTYLVDSGLLNQLFGESS